MTDTILIQQAFNAQGGQMLALAYDRHMAYCAKFGIDYWAQTGYVRGYETDPERAWGKLRLAQLAMLQGYKFVAWLDIDAYLFDFTHDFREACVGPVNMVRWLDPLDHYQAGVMYFNNSDGRAYHIVSRLLEEVKYWLEWQPTLRGWYEQGQMNYFSKHPDYASYFNQIDLAWNWGVHFCDKQPCEHPIVRAWHGVEWAQKFNEMKRELGK